MKKSIYQQTGAPEMPFKVDKRDKKTYNTTFKAEYGKLE